MIPEKDLNKLLFTLEPSLNEGTYVFCTVAEVSKVDLNEAIMMFKEKEGITIILRKEIADQYQLHYTFVAAWITLTVFSSLDAVGLTAAFSKALTEANISCNVIAGYFHDHIFIDQKDAERAMKLIEALSQQKK
jgi:hypothetical protein